MPHAVLAWRHGIPFVVVAPVSTVDLATADGTAITIEERAADEVRWVLGEVAVAPTASPTVNPAFDVTPADLVSVLVTERGAVSPSGLSALLGG